MPISRSLFVESKKLRVYDFDDTLVKTNSFIYVTHKNGKTSKLTPGQYAIYKEQPGDKFDYRDFQQVTNPQIIKGYVELLRRMVNSGGSREVFILTARSAERPVSQFIKDLGIKGVTVVALACYGFLYNQDIDWVVVLVFGFAVTVYGVVNLDK